VWSFYIVVIMLSPQLQGGRNATRHVSALLKRIFRHLLVELDLDNRFVVDLGIRSVLREIICPVTKLERFMSTLYIAHSLQPQTPLSIFPPW